MKIATRIALATSTVVAVALGAYGVLSLRQRRAELESDLQRKTVDLASSVAAAVQAEAELGKQVGDPLNMARKLGAVVLKLDDYEAKNEPQDALERSRLVQIEGQPVRGFSSDANGAPYLALAFPVFSSDHQVVGVIEIRRDATYIGREMTDATVRMLITIVCLVGGLALAVVLIARAAVSRPLGRMLREIEEVAKGDLTRTVFAERE